jgi:hypothetical protein
MTEMVSCWKDSTLLLFLGLGRFGLGVTNVFLMELFRIWHERSPWPTREVSCGRLQGLEDLLSNSPYISE